MIAMANHPQSIRQFEEEFRRFGSEPCTANAGKRLFHEQLSDADRRMVEVSARRFYPRDADKAHSLAVLTAQAATEFSGLHGHSSTFSQELNDRDTRAALLANCVPHVAGMHSVKQWLNLSDTHEHLKPGVYMPQASCGSVTRGGR